MSAQSTTSAAFADTYISSANPDTNYGTATSLKVEDSSSLSERMLVDFLTDVPAGSTINSVTLDVMPTKTASVGVTVYGYLDAWSESTLTWNTSGAYPYMDPLGTSTSETSGTYTAISLPTSVIGNDGGYTSFLIHASSTAATQLTFASREVTATPPKLVIGYTPPPVQKGTWVDPLTVGNDSTTTAMDSNLTTLHSEGVNHVELTADLNWLCPTSVSTCSGNFTSYLSPVITEATGLGITVSLQVHGTPTWVDPTAVATAGVWYGPATSSDDTLWSDAFAALVTAYGTTVDYEVWNEPDNGDFWLTSSGSDAEPNADNYAALLESAFLAAKAVNPGAVIVGGNFSRAALGYLGEMYTYWNANVAADTLAANHYFFDLLGMHPYSGGATSGYAPDTAPGSNDQTVSYYNSVGHELTGTSGWDFLDFTRMNTLVDTKEGSYKNLAFGEFGFTTDSGNYFYEPDATRATYVTQAYDLTDGVTVGGQSGVSYVRYLSWYKYYQESGDGADELGFALNYTPAGTASLTAFEAVSPS